MGRWRLCRWFCRWRSRAWRWRHTIHKSCFPGHGEAIVDSLRASEQLKISLVTVFKAQGMRHIAMSPVTTSDGKIGIGLAPVAVLETRSLQLGLCRARLKSGQRQRTKISPQDGRALKSRLSLRQCDRKHRDSLSSSIGQRPQVESKQTQRRPKISYFYDVL
jgi:hypothetical protein